MARGYTGAVDRLEMIVHWQPLAKKYKRLAQTITPKAKAAMGKTVGWWHAIASKHIPVAARVPKKRTTETTATGGNKSADTGRSTLRKSLIAYNAIVGDEVRGGLVNTQPYAIWLMAGTRHIAGGRVMRWKPGDALIQNWPAKARGGAKAGAMPIIIPWLWKARQRLVDTLRGVILND